MKCKFCGEEMPELGKICSNCGRDNSVEEVVIADPAAQVAFEKKDATEAKPENTPEVVPEATKMKRIALISGCIAVLAVLALVLFIGLQGKFDLSSIEMFRENNVFKKDSYTVSDAEAQRKADRVVATAGDAELTNSQLQVYYWRQIEDFLSQYNYYLTYLNLDYTKPLDQQQCPMLEGCTWEQYFLEYALMSWLQNQVVANAAYDNNFQMDSSYRQQLENVETNMAATATQYGFESAEALLQAQYGSNITIEDYLSYWEVYYNANLYFDVLTAALEEPSDDVLADYFEENKETLEAGGIKKDGVRFVNVRHILIKVDGGIEAEDGTITFSDEALAAEGYAEAEAILAQWLENPTEENFAALAKEYTEDSNGEAGGLYTDVYPGMMVTTFNDWCFDESRQKGDYGIVETRFGYHIMFLSDFGEELWLADTRDAYMSQKQSEILQELLAEYQMEVNYSKIALAFVDLS